MAKINSLTDAQIAEFPRFVKEWTEIGLSTKPADRPRAEAAVLKMYAIAGLAEPKIVWCGSPLSMALTRAILLKTPSVGASVGDSVGASVRNSVWDSVRDSVGDSVWDSVWASVMESVRDSVWDSVGDSVRDSVRDSVGDSVRDSVYGQHDASWLAFYRYFHDVLNLTDQTKRLDGLWEFSQSAGWAMPCRGICFVAERHNILHRDDAGRLHCKGGPALQYPDGSGIYAIHGVRVLEQVVKSPETLTPAQIEGETNAEVRRVMIERFGPDRYMREAGAVVVDHNERWGTLWRKPRPSDSDMLMLEVVNRSPEPDGEFRHYWLRVHPECRPLPTKESQSIGDPQNLTALNAVASTFGMRGRDYAEALTAES